MWKKDEPLNATDARRPEADTRTQPIERRGSAGERATIGRSIAIKGDVNGDEDLLIQGRVDGSVTLKQHAVTVGPEGEVKADIGARVITVEGSVEGNLHAQEQVILRGSARVLGNITSPRVVLEDGARFRGGVDMTETASAGKSAEETAWGRGTDQESNPSTDLPEAESSSAASLSR